MLFNSIPTVLLLASFVYGVPAANHVLHERRDFAHNPEFTRRSVAPSDARVPVRIGMTQRNLDIGHDLLLEVSHHESPKYGQHYSAKEVIDLFAPSNKTVTAVAKWLKEAGIKSFAQSVNKQWMQFDTTIEALENLLKTKYHEYEHSPSGGVHVACDEYHLPSHIREHVDYITPGINLMSTVNKPPSGDFLEKRGNNYKLPYITKAAPASLVLKAQSDPLALCDMLITPDCIFALYNISQPKTSMPGNELGIFEALADYYSQADLNIYYAAFAKNIPKGTKPILKGIDGGGKGTVPAATGEAGGESNLDFQAAIPLLYPQKTVLFQTDDAYIEYNYVYNGFLNNFFDGIDGSYCKYTAFGITGNDDNDPTYPDHNPGGYNGTLQCGVHKPTNVISISYGGSEYWLSFNYQKRQCNEILKLGLQGTTVVASSGDSGVGARSGCINETNVFSPQFPASCPYVVAVGSTYLPPGKDVHSDQEIATEAFPSGGGFSNIYPTPDYQSPAVQKFLTNHSPNLSYYTTTDGTTFTQGPNQTSPGVYNRAGRGYPDVSAVGFNFLSVVNKVNQITGGTSLSAPVFAAVLTRINEERLIVGKKTLGFVHPALYANPSLFHDITVGSNVGCPTGGFKCAAGWDPVTGLGTPKYDKMLQYFLSLP